MTNLEIIKSTYEGKTSEDIWKNLPKYLAANVRWKAAEGFPYAGIYIGFQSIHKNVFSRLANEWEDYKLTVEDCMYSDDRVIAYGTYSGIYKATGKFFEARFVHLWKLRNGKIVSFEQIVDSKPVNDCLS
jgi:ketosteroid isomerase-like protein